MSEVNGWAALLDHAGVQANRYNTGPGPARRLAIALVGAQGDAVMLALDITNASTAAPRVQRSLVSDLSSAAADCA